MGFRFFIIAIISTTDITNATKPAAMHSSETPPEDFFPPKFKKELYLLVLYS